MANASLEVRSYLENDLEMMDPVISYSITNTGWRGLTSHGEVLEVKGSNGSVPSEIVVACGGEPIGRRFVNNDLDVDIDDYLLHFNRVVYLYKNNRLAEALAESDLTLASAPTLRAKFNRSMILLAMGRWREGLSEYWECEQEKPFMRPQVEHALSLGLKPWRGEPLTGKRLLLLHAHGFGDTIMCLRYVPRLKRSIMVMPPELSQLAAQLGPVVSEPVDCDFFCPMLHLLHVFNVSPEHMLGGSYIGANRYKWFIKRWADQLGPKPRKRIGVAWSIGKPSDGDYPREIGLGQLVELLGGDVELHSVQQSKGAGEYGVIPHQFEDFADCAALMTQMDEIVSVDTAALHLAGAIGHPKVTGLLSYWSSWRWQAQWYNNVHLCRQTSTGDWASAMAQR